VLRAALISTTGGCGGAPDSIQVFYNDEHALTLGIRQVQVKTSSGTTITPYAVTPMVNHPADQAFNPAVGSMITCDTDPDQADTDVSCRPIYPALFVTDLSVPPGSTNPYAGDWQYTGGAGTKPDAVFGTWKAAVKTVDKTKNPNVVTVTPDGDPAKNNWNLGPGADPVPPGLTDQGYGTEIRWNISSLNLIPGHQYRVYFMVHDGDQNKTGGDSGQGCLYFTMSGTASTPTPSATASPSPTATATSTATGTPTPTATVSPASMAASASANSGNTVTTSSFTLKANTTYIVFAFTESATGDSATFSSTFSGSPAFTPIGAGSLNYNTNDYEFGQWINGGATDSAGTITVTFAKGTHQAYLQVVKLSGNNLAVPIEQSAYTSGNNTNPYTANLPAPTTAGDQEVVFLSGGEDLGGSAPPATPSSTLNLVYLHSGGGSAGTYANGTATQNTSFAGSNHHWGTIAVEINN
jgi:hypothetical protein